MSSSSTMYISERAASMASFYAMAFGEKAAALEAQGHHVIRLNIGEPDFGAPAPVLAAMQTILQQQDLPYTSALGLPALRQAIADFYQSHHGVSVSPSRVIVTAGASAALLLVCSALVNPGDKVMIGDPSYPCNRQFVSTFGGDVQLVPTDETSHFQLNLPLVESHWQADTKGLMIATPSNPTGTAIDTPALSALCEFAKSRGAFRIIDEIYLNLHHQTQQPETALALDNDAIVINSFSKFFGMTGWRLGWCVVPDGMVDVMERLAQNLYICPSTLAQHAALSCFTQASLDECEQRRQLLIARKTLIIEGLEEIGLSVPVVPDGAFYVYIDVSTTGLDAMTFCEQALAQAKVALTPGNDFGLAQARDFVRLSFASSEENLTEGIRRLGEFVATL